MVVAGISHIGYPVAYPESRVPREGDGIRLGVVVAKRNAHVLAIDRRVGNHVRVVVAPPKDAANGVGQVDAHLADDGEGRLLRGDGTLVEILLAIAFPG